MEIMAKGTVDNRVSEFAGRRRISITDLAKKAGISYQSAYAIWYGRTTRIDFDTMAGLCEALDTTVGELFPYMPPQEEIAR